MSSTRKAGGVSTALVCHMWLMRCKRHERPSDAALGARDSQSPHTLTPECTETRFRASRSHFSENSHPQSIKFFVPARYSALLRLPGAVPRDGPERERAARLTAILPQALGVGVINVQPRACIHRLGQEVAALEDLWRRVANRKPPPAIQDERPPPAQLPQYQPTPPAIQDQPTPPAIQDQRSPPAQDRQCLMTTWLEDISNGNTPLQQDFNIGKYKPIARSKLQQGALGARRHDELCRIAFYQYPHYELTWDEPLMCADCVHGLHLRLKLGGCATGNLPVSIRRGTATATPASSVLPERQSHRLAVAQPRALEEEDELVQNNVEPGDFVAVAYNQGWFMVENHLSFAVPDRSSCQRQKHWSCTLGDGTIPSSGPLSLLQWKASVSYNHKYQCAACRPSNMDASTLLCCASIRIVQPPATYKYQCAACRPSNVDASTLLCSASTRIVQPPATYKYQCAACRPSNVDASTLLCSASIRIVQPPATYKYQCAACRPSNMDGKTQERAIDKLAGRQCPSPEESHTSSTLKIPPHLSKKSRGMPRCAMVQTLLYGVGDSLQITRTEVTRTRTEAWRPPSCICHMVIYIIHPDGGLANLGEEIGAAKILSLRSHRDKSRHAAGCHDAPTAEELRTNNIAGDVDKGIGKLDENRVQAIIGKQLTSELLDFEKIARNNKCKIFEEFLEGKGKSEVRGKIQITPDVSSLGFRCPSRTDLPSSMAAPVLNGDATLVGHRLTAILMRCKSDEPLPQDEGVARFKAILTRTEGKIQEADILARVCHKVWFPFVYGIDIAVAHPYLVQEFVPCEEGCMKSVNFFEATADPPTLAMAAAELIQVVEAVRYLHLCHILHNDIKAALSMGINFPHVRYVVHYSPPSDMEQMLQQVLLGITHLQVPKEMDMSKLNLTNYEPHTQQCACFLNAWRAIKHFADSRAQVTPLPRTTEVLTYDNINIIKRVRHAPLYKVNDFVVVPGAENDGKDIVPGFARVIATQPSARRLTVQWHVPNGEGVYVRDGRWQAPERRHLQRDWPGNSCGQHRECYYRLPRGRDNADQQTTHEQFTTLTSRRPMNITTLTNNSNNIRTQIHKTAGDHPFTLRTDNTALQALMSMKSPSPRPGPSTSDFQRSATPTTSSNSGGDTSLTDTSAEELTYTDL
ncbi:hypothetical protein Bbelb_350140 [Branchiostoma belcheri]|nr:hypothetical protein Bbelb_350140 [Branchiostoma belcheri]